MTLQLHAQRHTGSIRLTQHMAAALWPLGFSTNPPPPSQKRPALCPENVLPLAARPHSAMVVHQLHHTLPGVPSVCQMDHSVWAFWPDRCEFYRLKSVLKTAGALYVCVCFFFCLCICVLFILCICMHVLIIINIKYSFYIPIVWVTIAYSKQKQIKANKTVPYLILLNFQWHLETWAI